MARLVPIVPKGVLNSGSGGANLRNRVIDPTSHLDLLVALVARSPGDVSAALDASGDGLATFGAFARRNQLSGFLHTVVSEMALGGLLPPELQRDLQRRYAMESRKRDLIHGELVRVTEAFRSRRVDCIVLKGPQLASRFYGGIDRRVYWDLDLLVRAEHLAASRRLLLECGFEQQTHLLFGERISIAVAHALDYGRGEVGLDLHWKLSSHPSFRIDYPRLWERRQPWAIGSGTYDVLSADYVLTLNLLSSFKDIERGAFRVRSFVDLWMILRAIEEDLDWDGFFAERQEENVVTLCTSVLALFLLVFQGAERFPRLARTLSMRHDASRVPTRAEAIELIEPTFVGPARRLWASQVYQTALSRHLVWWAFSLPVRMNVHKPGKIARLSNHLRAWLRPPR